MDVGMELIDHHRFHHGTFPLSALFSLFPSSFGAHRAVVVPKFHRKDWSGHIGIGSVGAVIIEWSREMVVMWLVFEVSVHINTHQLIQHSL